jgi:signal transduction histidine kinase
MEGMHSLLKRQLKRCFGEGFTFPDQYQPFLEAIDAAYKESDTDREMLERSLELSSQELLHANSEMRAVFQAIPDLLFRIDYDGRILDFKAGTANDLLIPARELFGKRIYDVPSPTVGEQFRFAIASVVAENKSVAIDYSLTHRGQHSSYEARFIPLPERQLIVIIRNISERKRADEELRSAVSLLRSTLESTANGTLVVDLNGKIVLYNKRFAEIWDIPEEILNSRDDDAALNHALERLKDPEEFLQKVRELYASPQAESFDVVEFKDGRVFERYSCPQMLDCEPVGRVWRFHEVTKQRQLEAQLRQVQKMEAFGQLAAGVAHDFNNILTVIHGNLSLLRMGCFTEEQTAPAIDHAVQATERAANLTRQLLTFSRRQMLQPKDVDLNEVVADMTKMLQRVIGEHIAMETHYAPGGAPVHADSGMMQQVLMNLAVNSRDSMPYGGKLLLETTTVVFTPGQCLIKSNAKPGEYICLTVADTGCGIPPSHLPYIFEPFFTTKEIGKGTGLGLATVFGIVEQHAGWIDVESQVDLGTTFRIYLPRLEKGMAALTEPKTAIMVKGGSESILLVEDELPVRELMRTTLEQHGYRVFEAVSGPDALNIWAQQRNAIDLLITDIVMPEGINGHELSDRLQADKPGLKIIQCSGYALDPHGKSVTPSGQVNFLEKPFDPRRLLQLIRECLDYR